MKARVHSFFVCAECGADTPKWAGQCPACAKWNTLTEKTASRPSSRGPGSGAPRRLTEFSSAVTRLADLKASDVRRRPTGIGEFDRILGGGLVPGSLVLLGGPPGIGKSTLMLQAADRLAAPDFPVLYVSGEESPEQVRSRSVRIGAENPSLLFASETDLEKILDAVRETKPRALVVDSVQTVHKAELGGAPGAVTQIRECAAELLHLAKGEGLGVFLLGHVTKDGDLAGPRVLEHMVDTVLYFETEREDVHRVLRAIKNRFGPTNEIGVFEMTAKGLAEVTNPSALFLGEREGPAPAGTSVLAALEGTRPLMVEIQALVVRTLFGMPRRQVSGVDYNRASLLIAVLDRRCGFHLDSQDVYVKATGGIDVREPASDLAVCAAVASAVTDRPLPPRTVWLGEVGLGGELRSVPQVTERLTEAAKLGFTKAMVPASALRGRAAPAGINVQAFGSLSDALRAVGLAPGGN
ncbi:MAG: DNA repair protein RadA [Elusimicrobia bacterium]|nr:DNA repair protein RadA [Elusimicrobiota bacterium]